MRAIFPVFLVVLGLGAREYVDLNVPGGLAYADRAALVELSEETAIAWYEAAPLQAQRVLQKLFSNMEHRHGRTSARRHRHSQRLAPPQRSRIFRADLRPGDEQPVEIRFVVPIDKPAERRRGPSSRRRP